MPSGEIARMQAMAEQLRVASLAGDWERLRQLDQLLASWLAPGAWRDPAQQVAGHRLQQAHAQAFQACVAAKQQLAEQLGQLRQQQEAKIAYAWQEAIG